MADSLLKKRYAFWVLFFLILVQLILIGLLSNNAQDTKGHLSEGILPGLELNAREAVSFIVLSNAQTEDAIELKKEKMAHWHVGSLGVQADSKRIMSLLDVFLSKRVRLVAKGQEALSRFRLKKDDEVYSIAFMGGDTNAKFFLARNEQGKFYARNAASDLVYELPDFAFFQNAFDTLFWMKRNISFPSSSIRSVHFLIQNLKMSYENGFWISKNGAFVETAWVQFLDAISNLLVVSDFFEKAQVSLGVLVNNFEIETFEGKVIRFSFYKSGSKENPSYYLLRSDVKDIVYQLPFVTFEAFAQSANISKKL